MPIINIELDLTKPQNHIQTIEGRQGDTQTIIRAAIYDDGVPYDFTGKRLSFAFIRPPNKDNPDPRDNWVKLLDCCEHIGNTHKWDITLPKEATAYDGLAKLCYCVVENDDFTYVDSTENFQINLSASATAEAHLGPYCDQVNKMLYEAWLIVEAWKEQMEWQKAEFTRTQNQRNSEFQAAQTQRENAFNTAESKRQSTFDANEKNRTAKTDAAAKRATDAADAIDQAIANEFDPLLDEWLRAHLNKYEDLGVMGYQYFMDWMDSDFECSQPDIDTCLALIGA